MIRPDPRALGDDEPRAFGQLEAGALRQHARRLPDGIRPHPHVLHVETSGPRRRRFLARAEVAALRLEEWLQRGGHVVLDDQRLLLAQMVPLSKVFECTIDVAASGMSADRCTNTGTLPGPTPSVGVSDIWACSTMDVVPVARPHN